MKERVCKHSLIKEKFKTDDTVKYLKTSSEHVVVERFQGFTRVSLRVGVIFRGALYTGKRVWPLNRWIRGMIKMGKEPIFNPVLKIKLQASKK